MKHRHTVLVTLLSLCPNLVTADEPLPTLAPGSLVRIQAPEAIHIPGVLTATKERVEWLAERADGDPSLLLTKGDWPEPIATAKPGATLRGRVVSADASGIVMTLTDRQSTRVRVPSEAIARLEVSRGRGSRVKQAIIGGGLGLGVGLALTGVVLATCEGGLECASPAAVGFLASTSLLSLGVVSGVLAPGERWKAVPRQSPPVSVSRLGRDGIGVRVSLSF